MIEILKVKDMCSSSINIESKKGKELADRFGLDHAYYMVFKEENGQFQIVDRSQDNFLDENKISAFFPIRDK